MLVEKVVRNAEERALVSTFLAQAYAELLYSPIVARISLGSRWLLIEDMLQEIIQLLYCFGHNFRVAQCRSAQHLLPEIVVLVNLTHTAYNRSPIREINAVDECS